MTYLRAYKSYINSQYVTEGIRMTAGILIPAFVMSYFNILPAGIIVSLGAFQSAGKQKWRKYIGL